MSRGGLISYFVYFPLNPFAFHFYQWFVSILSAMAIGMSKAGFVGIGVVPVVLMAHVLPTKASTGVILPMLMIGDMVSVILFHRHAIWRYVLYLLPAAVVGVMCGAWLMSRIPSSVFGHVLGGLILLIAGLMLLLRFFRNQVARIAQHPGVAFPSGWLAGVTTMLANISGPLMTVYLLACKLPKMQFVGTLSWFFFLLNLSKLPFSAGMGFVNRESLFLNLLLAPFVLFGAWLGRRLLPAFSQSAFEMMLLLLTFAGGAQLMITG